MVHLSMWLVVVRNLFPDLIMDFLNAILLEVISIILKDLSYLADSLQIKQGVCIGAVSNIWLFGYSIEEHYLEV